MRKRSPRVAPAQETRAATSADDVPGREIDTEKQDFGRTRKDFPSSLV
jgi:hypothetical protein